MRIESSSSSSRASDRRQVVRIRVDHREVGSGVPECLDSIPWVEVRLESLPLGDYVLSDRVVIERKSTADLAASIIDRRLFNQADDLLAAYQRVIYLVEGESLYEASHVHPNALRGAISYLIVLKGATLIHSEGPEDSAWLVATMARQEQHGLGYQISKHPKRSATSPDLLMRYVVEDLPGVGPKTAHALLTQFGSLQVLFGAGEDDLTRVPGIGPKRARQIAALLRRAYRPT